MKMLVTGMAFVVGMILCTQAFAETGGARCPNMVWKNGHYICGEIADND